MAHTAASSDSDDSLILNVSESSYEAEVSESDSHDNVDDIGYMPYRFEPYASESDSESDETNSESDSGDDNPPDDREIPLDLQRMNNFFILPLFIQV